MHGSPWAIQTARKEAERLLMIVRQGIDPVEAQREAKRKEKALNFSAYYDMFVDLYAALQRSKLERQHRSFGMFWPPRRSSQHGAAP